MLTRLSALRFLLVALFPLVSCLAPMGCANPRRGPAVPSEKADHATVFNNPAIRTWDSHLSEPFLAEIRRAGSKEFELLASAGQTGQIPPAHYLAISGGGANGAYGAGLLCGWTKVGTRPNFKLVTGVSTGALTAPFAFLGPAYDAKLKEVYTTITTKDLLSERGKLAALFDDALMDTTPMARVLERIVDDAMLDQIAAEYQKGRILLVATTNLDAGRGVLWNLGALASLKDPAARKLIRRILLASASIPAAFPPVMVDVQADGATYQEMHVDGGATAQLFLYPPSYDIRASTAAVGITRDRNAYVIRNARLDSQWADTQRRTLSIAGRAVSTLIQTQGVGDLYRVYYTCKRDEVEFNLAFIPSSFDEKSKEAFDPAYMSKLFDVGEQDALKGQAWHKIPPGLERPSDPAGS